MQAYFYITLGPGMRYHLWHWQNSIDTFGQHGQFCHGILILISYTEPAVIDTSVSQLDCHNGHGINLYGVLIIHRSQFENGQ